MPDREPIILAVASERRLVLFAVGALGVSCVMTQLALMRELMGAFSGNEMVLGVVLGLWLLLMGIGTWLGRTSDKLRNPLAGLLIAQCFIAIIPLLQVFALRAWRNVVFIRGAEVGVTETVISIFVLLLPYCLVAGYALTLACSLLARKEGPAGVGSVYVADSIGSIVGGVLFSFVLIRFLDHIALLVVPAALNLAAAAQLGRTVWRRSPSIPLVNPVRRGIFILTLIAGISVFTWLLFNADAFSTSLQFHGQHVLSCANSPYGRLVVTESDGQTNFIENGVAIVSTPNVEHVEETVHYAMAQRPDARKVLLVSGGISGTAKEILKYNVSRVDYVELDPLILELGRKYLPENLADSRIRIINTDGRLFIKQAGGKYDVVIVDVPDPSTAQLNRFYTAEFQAEVKRVLSKDGVLSFSLGHYENYVSKELARMLASACCSLKLSFQNVLMIPGGRVFFLASDGPLYEDIAARIGQRQIPTKLVNRHYLDAMLTADRMADLARATAQPAAVNKDFNPVLYYYHLRHWMSQFKAGFGVLQTLLLVLLCVYLVRLRGPALVLFASGFAGSALELVLLLAFQVLCGSVYHQVGVVVTVFMAGLALGAVMMNRLMPQANRGSLALLALAVAGYAILLAFLLPLLNRMGGTAGSLVLVKAAIASLTLILAVLVGMQFPLANRLEFDGTVTGASRLYTADFVGAFLGALLASTLLIPLMGVAGVCLLTAALNFLGGAMIQFRKAVI
jgi:spermidine synthase